ncbi:MAG: DNA phosphorothioation-associated DGQHR protein 1 [Thiobacillus sp.]|nr:DNA phosphorothioation-associated DGQHR protein 1 [Thiobacillus sp.]
MTETDSINRLAIRVNQPLGTFYAFSLGADVLDRITYSQPAEVMERMEQETDENKGGYSIFGTQRGENKKRLDEIASFIRTTEATFPNAIILAANYDQEGRYIEDEARRWAIEGPDEGPWKLHIPSSSERSASIIDGQHRLHAFNRLPPGAPERSMELLCVVFLELPTPYHAYVFATINFNQKKVDRSLAYELFGFDVDERPAQYWSPETLAVYLTRLMNTEKKSPLFRSIFPAADSDRLFSDADGQADGDVRVSMATIVDGILRLLSKNPREDRNIVRRPENRELGRESLSPINGVPLRTLYIQGNDKAIYDLLCNYFAAVRFTVWSTAGKGSYLRKTVGVQALFDVLRELLISKPITAANFSYDALVMTLTPCSNLDPTGDKYQASGIGRSDIRRELLQALKMAAT